MGKAVHSVRPVYLSSLRQSLMSGAERTPSWFLVLGENNNGLFGLRSSWGPPSCLELLLPLFLTYFFFSFYHGCLLPSRGLEIRNCVPALRHLDWVPLGFPVTSCCIGSWEETLHSLHWIDSDEGWGCWVKDELLESYVK